MDIARRPSHLPAPARRRDAVLALDLALGASRSALAAAALLARGAGTVGRPVLRVALHPPVVSPAHSPDAWLRALSRRGGRQRVEVRRALERLLAAVARVDLDAIIQRLDLNRVVREYLDLNGIVASVDLDAAVAGVDLDAIIERLDLNRVVREYVDLDAAVEQVDVAAVVARVDVVGVAEEVIGQVDLPEIIRDSTGSMASDTLREVRMQSISGDEAVTRAMDRLRLRRHRRGASPDGGAPSTDGVPRQPDPVSPREP